MLIKKKNFLNLELDLVEFRVRSKTIIGYSYS